MFTSGVDRGGRFVDERELDVKLDQSVDGACVFEVKQVTINNETNTTEITLSVTMPVSWFADMSDAAISRIIGRESAKPSLSSEQLKDLIVDELNKEYHVSIVGYMHCPNCGATVKSFIGGYTGFDCASNVRSSDRHVTLSDKCIASVVSEDNDVLCKFIVKNLKPERVSPTKLVYYLNEERISISAFTDWKVFRVINNLLIEEEKEKKKRQHLHVIDFENDQLSQVQ
jgi:hypothetical protein